MGRRYLILLSAVTAVGLAALAVRLPAPLPVRLIAGWVLVSVPVSICVCSLLRPGASTPEATVTEVHDGTALVRFAGHAVPVATRTGADAALLQVWARSSARVRCDLAEGATALRLSRGDLRVEVPLAGAALV